MNGDLKVDGLRSLLLGPIYLYEQIVAVFLPGTIFLFLLFAKQYPPVVAALSSPLLGYNKTKLFCALIVAYVVGTVFTLPAVIAINIMPRLFPPDVFKKSSGASSNASLYEKLSSLGKSIVVAPAVAPLMGKSNMGDLLTIALASLNFRISTGSVLVVASFIPHDGLERIELLGGLLLLATGIAGLIQLPQLIGVVLSIGIAGAVANASPQQIRTGWELIKTLLFKDPKKKPSEGQGAPAETADNRDATSDVNPEKPRATD